MLPDRVSNQGPLTYESGALSIALRSPADTVYYMELSQEKIIQKPKMQELSSLFMTHRLIVMYAPVKFHKVLELWLGHESGMYGRTDGRTDVRDRQG